MFFFDVLFYKGGNFNFIVSLMKINLFEIGCFFNFFE